MRDLLVVVPMKNPALAKTRLRSALNDQSREQLARGLFIRTVTMLRDLQSEVGFDIAVVTACDDIATIARNHDALLINEETVCGLNQAASRAANFARDGGWQRMCILPADLARPEPDDLRRILSYQLVKPGMAICPSKDFGTNALLLSPPDAMPFAYGPQSFHRHLRLASEAELSPVILPYASLRLDLDSPDDLAALRGEA